MDTLIVVVRAASVAQAGTAGIAEARRRAFDPLRVLRIQPLRVQDGPGGPEMTYRVQVAGDAIPESEARALWGDR